MFTKAHTWPRNESATLKDVAKSVGVSESLASVVLNGSRSGTRVSASTRARVIEAAELMGYRPNGVARSLFTGKTNRLGLYSGFMLDHPSRPFATELMAGFYRGAKANNVDLLIHTFGDGADGCRVSELLTNRSIDGLIIHAMANDPILPLLGEVRVPVVAIADQIDQIPSVCSDDREGGAMAARYLHDLGHRHVLAAIACTRSGNERLAAFSKVAQMLDLKITPSEGWGFLLSPQDIKVLTRDVDRATAVFVWNDENAMAICEQLIALGIDVPRQVALIGYDGFDIVFGHKRRLTTIQANWRNVAFEAINLLMSLIGGKPIPNLTSMPVHLKLGNTA